MAFAFLIFSSVFPIFAEGNEYLPTQYLTKSKILPNSIEKMSQNGIIKRRKIAQKAFLTALLCVTGTNIEITSIRNVSSSYATFKIHKVNGVNIDYSNNTRDNKSLNLQIAILINEAKKNKNIELNIVNKGQKVILSSAKINNYFLNQLTICKIGEKILELIKKYKSQICVGETIKFGEIINLNKNIPLMNGFVNILGELLKNENTPKIFELTSNSKKLDPITNPDHIELLNKKPNDFPKLMIYYQKIFFAGILSALGAKVSVKENNSVITADGLPVRISLWIINSFRTKSKELERGFSYTIKYINFICSRNEEIKIETLQMSYSTPIKVVINKTITLDVNDLYNLGQKFYNLICKMLDEKTLATIDHLHLIPLNKNPALIQGIKEIFKEYTGKELPDLKITQEEILPTDWDDSSITQEKTCLES